MKAKLTERERAVYDYIAATIRTEGYAPSVRDICAALGLKSTSTAHAYLARLEQKGVIRKESGKSRTLRIGQEGETPVSVRVPIVGRVAAGAPILAVENTEGYVDFTPVSGQNSADGFFALRIKGESMIEAGILDGDLVIVEKCCSAKDGEIVVALIDGEATVKTFYRDGSRIRLQPENRTMDPIYVTDVIILGKVAACLRYYA